MYRPQNFSKSPHQSFDQGCSLGSTSLTDLWYSWTLRSIGSFHSGRLGLRGRLQTGWSSSFFRPGKSVRQCRLVIYASCATSHEFWLIVLFMGAPTLHQPLLANVCQRCSWESLLDIHWSTTRMPVVPSSVRLRYRDPLPYRTSLISHRWISLCYPGTSLQFCSMLMTPLLFL